MRYLITTGFIVFLSIIRLNAQSDFRDGYIIGNDNDTIYGLLDYKGNKANAKKCIYRKDINSLDQIFTPEEIKGYRFADSKYYVSKSFKTGKETKQLFLEYLINGIVDIYYYRDDNGEHYLVDMGHDELYELKNEEKEVIIDNTRYITKSNAYIGILKALFRESPSISKRVENIALDHKSLIKVAHDYHYEVCTDQECIIYEKKLPEIRNTFGVVVGLNGLLISQINEYPEDLYYLTNSQFGFKIYPSIGLYYKVNMPFINERIYFQYEGTYSRLHVKTSNSFIEPIYNMNYLNDISVTQNAFNNLGYIKYEFPKGKIRPAFHLGAFVNYFFKTNFNRNLEVKFSWGDTYFTSQSKDSPFMKLDFGVNVGIGLSTNYLNDKELLLDFRYQRGFGWLNALNTNMFIVNAGFQIGR